MKKDTIGTTAADNLTARNTETSAYQTARLGISRLDALRGEAEVIDYGAIILCTAGSAIMTIDFKDWRLEKDAVMTLFPNDVVMLNDVSEDFEAEVLRYDKSMLREASMQIEQAVYSQLRQDRCRTNSRFVTRLVKGIFHLLRIYMGSRGMTNMDMIVLYQLKSFFLGFYDYIRENGTATDYRGTRRMNELFNSFMERLEADCRRAHDVAFYADALNITPKYLNNIVKSITRHTTKEIIDNYVILKIKLQLRNGKHSIKQLAWDFNFSDTPFFCRYFKQHTGMTTQQFRKLRSKDTAQ